MEIVLYVALAFGFYMAWTIGANDAANAIGTSVGSGALRFKQAVIIAAVFEFSGALLAGSGVADTMRKGIIDPTLFNAVPQGAEVFAIGMLSALIAAAIWLHFAAYIGWPVSTTHSIVGAITGFGTVALGASNVQWGTLLTILASWVVSPLSGGIMAFLTFTLIRNLVIDAEYPVRAMRRWAPIFALPILISLFTLIFLQVLPRVGFGDSLALAIAAALGAALIAAGILKYIIARSDLSVDESSGAAPEAIRQQKFAKVEKLFCYLQVISASYIAFAHGSNDVANAVGPLAGIVSLFEGTVFTPSTIGGPVPMPTWILFLGGIGIVIGLATYGYKVIETIGSKITEITPSRGFAAELGAASTIILGSKLGLPLSTTHTVVGAIIGVGFARGVNALNFKIILQIAKSWVYTLPFTAVLTAVLFYILRALIL